jgi:hypothetical protein
MTKAVFRRLHFHENSAWFHDNEKILSKFKKLRSKSRVSSICLVLLLGSDSRITDSGLQR